MSKYSSTNCNLGVVSTCVRTEPLLPGKTTKSLNFDGGEVRGQTEVELQKNGKQN
jgi:hypothetical protein